MSIGIGTRRELMTELTLALAPGSRERLLTIVRLHGLYALTDRDGPAARDRLLEEAQRLVLRELGVKGRVYVPRRDELCVLFETSLDDAILALDLLTASLNELGRPDQIVVEAGVALLPDEATDPISALERADRRILPPDYKGYEQSSASRHSRRGEAEAQEAEAQRAAAVEAAEAQLRLAG